MYSQLKALKPYRWPWCPAQSLRLTPVVWPTVKNGTVGLTEAASIRDTALRAVDETEGDALKAKASHGTMLWMKAKSAAAGSPDRSALSTPWDNGSPAPSTR